MRPWRPLVISGALALITVSTGAWVTAPGGPPGANTAVPDAPDPAALETSPGTAQVYATGGVLTHANSLTLNWVEGTQNFGYPQDAIPEGYRPSRLARFGALAPSVRQIGGQYVIWFTGANSGKAPAPNCLNVGVSSQPNGPFKVGLKSFYCSSYRQEGLLIPVFGSTLVERPGSNTFMSRTHPANRTASILLRLLG